MTGEQEAADPLLHIEAQTISLETHMVRIVTNNKPLERPPTLSTMSSWKLFHEVFTLLLRSYKRKAACEPCLDNLGQS